MKTKLTILFSLFCFLATAQVGTISTHRVLNLRIDSNEPTIPATDSTWIVAGEFTSDQMAQAINGLSVEVGDHIIDQYGNWYKISVINSQTAGDINCDVVEVIPTLLGPTGNSTLYDPAIGNLGLLVPANSGGITTATFTKILNHNFISSFENLADSIDLLRALFLSSPSIDTVQRYCPAHGITLASFTGEVAAISSECGLAEASDPANLQTGYVVNVTHPDTITVQVSGIVNRPAHGLTPGTVYFLQDTPDDGNSDVTAGSVESKTFVVLDADNIVLIDPSATSSGAASLYKPTNDSIGIVGGNAVADRSLMQELPNAQVDITTANTLNLISSALYALNVRDASGDNNLGLWNQGVEYFGPTGNYVGMYDKRIYFGQTGAEVTMDPDFWTAPGLTGFNMGKFQFESIDTTGKIGYFLGQDTDRKIRLLPAPSGLGDVTGPGSSTDNAIATFDGTGNTIQSSPATVDDLGNIATSGTVDGRDLSVDGAKLDGIEAGAQVNTISTVNGQTGAVALDADDITATDAKEYLSSREKKSTYTIKTDKLYLHGSEAYPIAADTLYINLNESKPISQVLYLKPRQATKFFPQNTKFSGLLHKDKVNRVEIIPDDNAQGYSVVFNQGYSPRAFTESVDAFILFGQSNASFFKDQTEGDSIKGADSLAILLEALPSWADTVTNLFFNQGGTSLAQVGGMDWNPSSEGELLDSLVYSLNGYPNAASGLVTGGNGKAMGEYRKSGRAVDIRFALWMQGENDSVVEAQANAYEDNLRALIAKVRARLNRPNMPFLFTNLGAAYTGTYKATINAAFTAVAGDTDGVYLVDVSDFDASYYHPGAPDPVHYTSKGTQEIANRIYQIVQSNGL